MKSGCCVCLDLKRACIVIGITDMVLYASLLASNYVQLIEFKWAETRKVFLDDVEARDEDLSFSEHVIGAIDSIVGIVVCTGLIFGTVNEKPGLILPWLMAAILSIVYYFIAKVLFVGTEGFTVYNAVFLIRILIAMLFFSVVYGFFKKLLTERQRSSSQISSL